MEPSKNLPKMEYSFYFGVRDGKAEKLKTHNGGEDVTNDK